MVREPREGGDRRAEGDGLYHLAIELRKSGDLARAVTALEECLRIREESKDAQVNDARRMLAQWQVDDQ